MIDCHSLKEQIQKELDVPAKRSTKDEMLDLLNEFGGENLAEFAMTLSQSSINFDLLKVLNKGFKNRQ